MLKWFTSKKYQVWIHYKRDNTHMLAKVCTSKDTAVRLVNEENARMARHNMSHLIELYVREHVV